MRRGSIRFRLWSAAAISIVLALAIAGVGLRFLFERHVERRVETDLTVALNLLVGATTFADGTLQISPEPSDPRFNVPLSGYYWQVEDLAAATLTRSRSLWDSILTLPAATAGDGRVHVHELPGPDNTLLVAVERTVIDQSGRAFRASVAEDHATVTQSVNQYLAELAPALAILGLVLLAAIFVQITVGLAPLAALREAVRDVVARRQTRLAGVAPTEVQPLAEEINRLLDRQDKAIARARTRAGDLAHGLKTPLQVLSSDIRALREKGEGALADEIEKSASAIRRHVERELARARLAPGTVDGASARFAETARRIVAVVERTPRGAQLTFDIAAPDDLTVPIDADDLSEALGNLVENAARYARSTVRITAGRDGDSMTITVTDDGPGIADADKEAVLTRGVKLNGSGSGFGLAIVADLAEAYGARLALEDANPGLRVRLSLPTPA